MVIELIRIVAVLIAAIMLGNWFQRELKKAKLNDLPWYRPYISLPGLIIIISILLLPVLVKFMS